MHYHLASSYYSFFFLYIYIFHGFPIYTRTNKTHTFQVWWIFQKKKEMFVLTYIRMCVRLCVYIYACATTRRECSWYPYLLSVACSQFFEFFFIFFSFLFFFFLPLRLLLHCRLVLLLFSEVCYYYIVKCPTDQLQWATIIYKSC